MASPVIALPSLVTGERMDREEFLRRWELMPDLKRAELIDGVVYVPSPLSLDHGRRDVRAIFLLAYYQDSTLGCQCASNTTWFMLDSSPQPDVFLRILPEYGGQSAIEGKYPSGAPELAIEVCVTSTEVDFGPKLALYQRAGVCEYVTFETLHRRIIWRVLEQGSYVKLNPGSDGVYRSQVFPGLWLDPTAFWADDGPKLRAVLDQGLAAPEHAAFMESLQARHQS